MRLTKDNFMLFAAKYYDNPQCVSEEEFHDDLKRFQYIKRLIKRFKDGGELRERLIINHIIVLYNCFGEQTTPMLFMKMKGYHEYIKPFIFLMNYLPRTVEYDGETIITDRIPMDNEICNRLRELRNNGDQDSD